MKLSKNKLNKSLECFPMKRCAMHIDKNVYLNNSMSTYMVQTVFEIMAFATACLQHVCQPNLPSATPSPQDPPGAGLTKAAVLEHRGGRADVGRGAAGRAQITLVQQLEQLFLSGAACVLERNTHSNGQAKGGCVERRCRHLVTYPCPRSC